MILFIPEIFFLMSKFASNDGNSSRILSTLSIKKVFIMEAIVRGESYFRNVIYLFRPSKMSTILKSFFLITIAV